MNRGSAEVAAIVCFTILTLAVMAILVMTPDKEFEDPVADLRRKALEVRWKAKIARLECYYTGRNSYGWGCPEESPVEDLYSTVRGLTGKRENRPRPEFPSEQ